MRYIWIYNLFPRLIGTFSKWKPHLERIAELGFNYVYFNPVEEVGFSGSLYSIKNYETLNPEFTGGFEEHFRSFKGIIDQAKLLGLSVINDLVINHSAIDCVLINSHPHWYKRSKDGKIINPGTKRDGRKVIWGDLASFNYDNPDVKFELIEYWKKIVKERIEIGINGFRCDAANQIPLDVWSELISYGKSLNSETIFFAESLGSTRIQHASLTSIGFDWITNSSLWWDYVNPWLILDNQITNNSIKTISFPETHDTERLTNNHIQENQILQRTLFTALFSEGWMITTGFEFNSNEEIHVVDSREHNLEKEKGDMFKLIQNLIIFKESYPYFGEDEWQYWLSYPETPYNSITILRKRSDSKIIYLLINNSKDFEISLNFEHNLGFSSPEDIFAFDSDLMNFKLMKHVKEYNFKPCELIIIFKKK